LFTTRDFSTLTLSANLHTLARFSERQQWREETRGRQAERITTASSCMRAGKVPKVPAGDPLPATGVPRRPSLLGTSEWPAGKKLERPPGLHYSSLILICSHSEKKERLAQRGAPSVSPSVSPSRPRPPSLSRALVPQGSAASFQSISFSARAGNFPGATR